MGRPAPEHQEPGPVDSWDIWPPLRPRWPVSRRRRQRRLLPRPSAFRRVGGRASHRATGRNADQRRRNVLGTVHGDASDGGQLLPAGTARRATAAGFMSMSFTVILPSSQSAQSSTASPGETFFRKNALPVSQTNVNGISLFRFVRLFRTATLSCIPGRSPIGTGSPLSLLTT
jgi:hypothetical protein